MADTATQVVPLDELKAPKALLSEVVTSGSWVGYQLHGRRFVDIQNLPGNAQEKMVHLRKWWNTILPPWRQTLTRIVLSQKPVIFIGTLAPLTEDGTVNLPHETQYQLLERSELLTRGFANPETLVDEADFFTRDPLFNVFQDPDSAEEPDPVISDKPTVRHVLFISQETDKGLLFFPLIMALLICTVISIAMAKVTGSVATGAQVGGTVGGCIAVVLCYIIWRLS